MRDLFLSLHSQRWNTTAVMAQGFCVTAESFCCPSVLLWGSWFCTGGPESCLWSRLISGRSLGNGTSAADLPATRPHSLAVRTPNSSGTSGSSTMGEDSNRRRGELRDNIGSRKEVGETRGKMLGRKQSWALSRLFLFITTLLVWVRIFGLLLWGCFAVSWGFFVCLCFGFFLYSII